MQHQRHQVQAQCLWFWGGLDWVARDLSLLAASLLLEGIKATVQLRGVEQVSDGHESLRYEVNEILPVSFGGLDELQLQGSAIG